MDVTFKDDEHNPQNPATRDLSWQAKDVANVKPTHTAGEVLGRAQLVQQEKFHLRDPRLCLIAIMVGKMWNWTPFFNRFEIIIRQHFVKPIDEFSLKATLTKLWT